ncbi:hypothetical protein [Caballeronia sp. KNU42]
MSSIRGDHRSLHATKQQLGIDPSSSVVDNPKIERVSLIGHPLMCMLPGGARLEGRRQSTCAIRTDARTVVESLDRFNQT